MKPATLAALAALIGGLLLIFGDSAPTPPTPVVPVDPVITEPGNRFLLVYEAEEKSEYPAEQAAIISSGNLAEYLDEHCVTSTDGPEWRMWDDDVRLTDSSGPLVSPVWIEAMALPRTSLPWLIVTNGVDDGYTGPLPTTESDVMAIVRRVFE